MNLSILIPAYNEAARIRPALKAYCDAIRGRDVELLVIVNGTNDNTERIIADEFMPVCPALRSIVIPERVGKGGALMRGLREARGDRIAFTDADGSTPPDALLSLADTLGDEGILIGSRWLPDSVIGRPQPFSRRFISRLFNLYVRLVFGLQVTDTQCGAKVLSRAALDSVLAKLGATQWAFDVELLFHIRHAGFRIREVPIEWNDVSGSKVKIFRSSIEMLLALTRLRLIFSPLKPLVGLWDRSLGRRLFLRRMERMRAIHRGLGET